MDNQSRLRRRLAASVGPEAVALLMVLVIAIVFVLFGWPN
jgi:hypothetical protein